jgi:hypothetical protein
VRDAHVSDAEGGDVSEDGLLVLLLLLAATQRGGGRGDRHGLDERQTWVEMGDRGTEVEVRGKAVEADGVV